MRTLVTIRYLRLKPETIGAPSEHIASHGITSPLRVELRLDLPNSPAGCCNLRDVIHWRFFFDVGFHFHFLDLLRATESHFTDRWIYSSALAYIVDANKGRSSTAVATNSAFRGIIAFIAAEIAIPLQVSSFPCDETMYVEHSHSIELEMVDCTLFGLACWSSQTYWSYWF